MNLTFDANVVYHETSLPLIDNGSYNIHDILDPNEDKNKYLKYNFNMPQWEYIDGFHSPNGYPTIISKYKKDKDGINAFYTVLENDNNYKVL